MKDYHEETNQSAVSTRPKAFSYLRFSTPEQERGDSFRRQSALAAAYAEKHGLELDQELTFHDLGVSAYRGRNAKKGALGQFITAIELGLVPEGSYLLVESLDRISREAPYRAAGTLRDIVDEGVIVVTLSDEKVYSEEVLSGQEGFMSFLFAILTMQRAHEESQIKGRRLAAAWENKRKRAKTEGHRLTRIAPAWLRWGPSDQWEVIEENAEVIRSIFRMSAEGLGQNAIAKKLNADGVPPLGRGERWHISAVRRILTNPAAVGTLVPHKLEHVDGRRRRIPTGAIPGYYPAIVDLQLWDRVQGRLKTGQDRGRHASRGTVKSCFAKLAICPACGSRMTRVSKGKRSRPKLVCANAKVGAGCKYVSVDQELVERALLAQGPQTASEVPVGPGAKAAMSALEGIETLTLSRRQELDNILAIESRGGSSPALRDKRRRLETEIEELQREAEELVREIDAKSDKRVAARRDTLVSALAKAQADGWENFDRKAVNDALLAAVESVVIDYRTGSLHFRWRHKEESLVVYGWPIEDAEDCARPPS